jgi:O-antigen ligase
MTDRRALAAALPLLALPLVLSFFSGGYFDQPRLLAGLAACGALVATALTAPRLLPATTPGRCAVGALALLAAWTALSITWAPLPGRAVDDATRVALYLAVFVVAVAVLRGAAARLVEPGLLAGIGLVCVYGLSERLLPGLVDLASSRSAAGRLEQPLTYWNAVGVLAAMGLVLAVRGAGDATRRAWGRIAAGAAAPVTGAALMLTFSRGGIVAAFAGLVVVAVLTPTRQGAVAARWCVGAALLAAVAVAVLPAVRTLSGDNRGAQGAIALVALLAMTALAAVGVRRTWRSEPAAAPARPERMRRVTVAGLGVAFLALSLVAAAAETGTPETGATAARLASADSNRYEYWRVALDTLAEHPVRGLGSGGFRQAWLEKRDFSEVVNDAHSLYLETATELGLVGLALLAALVGGIVACGLRALRRDREAALGPIAAFATFGLHAGIDWDWEMPAVTIAALMLAAVLVAAADPPAPAARTGRALRAAGVLGAVLVAVPLAVSLRSALLLRDARDVMGPSPAGLSRPEADRALRLLHRASELNADSEPEIQEIALLFLQKRDRESAEVAERLVRDEPGNVVAWRLALGLRRRLDPERAPAAAARVRELDPLRAP